MKLALTNSEMDDELRQLRKDKRVLEDQVTTLSVFEQGVTDMRAMLDDAVHARDEALDDLDRLASLQKKYSLTWYGQFYFWSSPCRSITSSPI